MEKQKGYIVVVGTTAAAFTGSLKVQRASQRSVYFLSVNVQQNVPFGIKSSHPILFVGGRKAVLSHTSAWLRLMCEETQGGRLEELLAPVCSKYFINNFLERCNLTVVCPILLNRFLKTSGAPPPLALAFVSTMKASFMFAPSFLELSLPDLLPKVPQNRVCSSPL